MNLRLISVGRLFNMAKVFRHTEPYKSEDEGKKVDAQGGVST
jgi:hypothetical protein